MYTHLDRVSEAREFMYGLDIDEDDEEYLMRTQFGEYPEGMPPLETPEQTEALF